MAKAREDEGQWEEVQSAAGGERWRPAKPGEQRVGIYHGHRAMPGKSGDWRLHCFESHDGSLWTAAGAMLDGLLESVTAGATVRVTHLGLEARSGGKTLRMYRVEVRRA